MYRSINRYTFFSAALVLLAACGGAGYESAKPPPNTAPAGAASTATQSPQHGAEVALPEREDRVARKLVRAEERSAGAGPRLQAQRERDTRAPAPRTLPASTPALAADLAGIRAASEPLDRENYAHFGDNPLRRVAEAPVSTFSIDVDTGAYANVRRFLHQGRLPPHDAVRVEELINYFSYQYPAPPSAEAPFSVTTETGPSPWNPRTHLLHVGIKGFELPAADLPAANLVFLIDVSGSMRARNKLELLKPALRMLVRQLSARDTIAIAVYAGASGTVLAPTPGDQHAGIEAAIDALEAGGSTNGAAGIRLAYSLAEQNLRADGVNRVILATDGDFNVGTTGIEALKELVAAKRRSGIALTTLGFGMGNYNDHLMEQIADVGDGNYAYIDTLNEARKVLVQEVGATLMTIARDVKIQLEFNPAVVSEYRLIGYVNRQLRREDFDNDRVDAGDIGAGHTVTALYEIALRGSGGERISSLRYQREVQHPPAAAELGFLRLRYKTPRGIASRLLEQPILRTAVAPSLDATSPRYRFSAAVAAFGQSLRGGDYLNGYGLQAVETLARGARGDDPFGYRAEFLQLVGLAATLQTPPAPPGE